MSGRGGQGALVATHDRGVARDSLNMIAASSRVGLLAVVSGRSCQQASFAQSAMNRTAQYYRARRDGNDRLAGRECTFSCSVRRAAPWRP